MGNLQGHRQVTLYVDPELYEKSRCSAYTLGENIYEFVSEALESAIGRRLNKTQREAIESMAKQNIRNGGTRRSRRARRNPPL